VSGFGGLVKQYENGHHPDKLQSIEVTMKIFLPRLEKQ